MKFKKLFALALAGAMMAGGFTACGSDEPDSPVQQNPGNDNNDQDQDGGGSTDGSLTLSQVKSRTQIKAIFSQYRYKITAEYTPLNGETPSFDWLLTRAGSNDGSRITGEGVFSSTKIVGGKSLFTLEFPMFLYYILRSQYDPYGYEGDWDDKWATSDMFLRSYDALNKKEASGDKLTSEELQLRKELVADLDGFAREIRYDLSIWIYLTIDGKEYNMGGKII